MGQVYADYGLGTLRSGTHLTSLSQEHGVLNQPLALGTRVRILPNHSCLTVACFDHYDVVIGDEVVDRWEVRRRR
jgi:D-serine deaminase-like pyridoxal phosphate-dependent protein